MSDPLPGPGVGQPPGQQPAAPTPAYPQPSFPAPGQPVAPDQPAGGWAVPPPGPSYAPPAGPSYAPPAGLPYAPQFLPGAAHKPGAVPLRPLGLTDIYDAAFRIIRFNPKATVGASVLVAAVSMALPLLVAAVLTATSRLGIDEQSTSSLSGADIASLVGTAGAFVIGSVLKSVGALLVTGLIVHVAMAAAIGRRLTLGQAWALTRGQRWRLVGLALVVFLTYLLPFVVYVGLCVLVVLAGITVLTVLWFVISVPAFFAFMAWLWIRVARLAVPALMVEKVGIFGSLSRAFALTRRQFWRTFGIALLTVIVTAIAAQVLSTPISLIFNAVLTGLGPEYVVLSLVITQAVTTVISAAFVTPFTASVISLQYIDQRMRKEAFDVELMQQAGVTAA